MRAVWPRVCSIDRFVRYEEDVNSGSAIESTKPTGQDNIGGSDLWVSIQRVGEELVIRGSFGKTALSTIGGVYMEEGYGWAWFRSAFLVVRLFRDLNPVRLSENSSAVES